MYPRLATDRLRTLAARFPAVVILGARQVGKTTLARQAFPDHAYVDLEDPRTGELFAGDPRFQLDQHRPGSGLIGYLHSEVGKRRFPSPIRPGAEVGMSVLGATSIQL